MGNEWYDEAPLIETELLPINVSPAEGRRNRRRKREKQDDGRRVLRGERNARNIVPGARAELQRAPTNPANPAARREKSVIAPLRATSRVLRAANETDRIPRVLAGR